MDLVTTCDVCRPPKPGLLNPPRVELDWVCAFDVALFLGSKIPASELEFSGASFLDVSNAAFLGVRVLMLLKPFDFGVVPETTGGLLNDPGGLSNAPVTEGAFPNGDLIAGRSFLKGLALVDGAAVLFGPNPLRLLRIA